MDRKDYKIDVYDSFENSLIDLIPKANREDVNNVLKAAEKGLWGRPLIFQLRAKKIAKSGLQDASNCLQKMGVPIPPFARGQRMWSYLRA